MGTIFSWGGIPEATGPRGPGPGAGLEPSEDRPDPGRGHAPIRNGVSWNPLKRSGLLSLGIFRAYPWVVRRTCGPKHTPLPHALKEEKS